MINLLVRADLTSMRHEPPGNYPCGAPKRKTFPILVSSNEVSKVKIDHFRMTGTENAFIDGVESEKKLL